MTNEELVKQLAELFSKYDGSPYDIAAWVNEPMEDTK